MNCLRLTLAISIACSAGAAVAGVNVKPGLWEHTTTTRTEGGPAMPQMPDLSNLPPEQRARIEQMMAGRMSGQPQTQIARTCITPDQLKEWDSYAKGQRDSGGPRCERKVLEQSPQHVKMGLSCEGGKTTGNIEFTATSSERVTGKIAMVSRNDGAPRTFNAEISGRWLGSDCGDIKPYERPPASGR
ncbi:MAG TPA: DUF3617 domain-containing protein [Casimicrobiaceae bacterium]